MEVREEVRQMAAPLAEESGLELVDVEFTAQGRHRIVRVLLDRPGGITVGDCSAFSRRLADCLDMNQTVPGAYHLEVSSPGMDRPLPTPEAVQRFAGRRGSIVTHDAHGGRRRFEGELLGAADGRAGLRDADGVEHWFEWTDVKSARLVVDPWGERRSRGGER
jgi:ribosome maturation factor RimP